MKRIDREKQNVKTALFTIPIVNYDEKRYILLFYEVWVEEWLFAMEGVKTLKGKLKKFKLCSENNGWAI